MESYSKEKFEAAPETPVLTEKEQKMLSTVEEFKDKMMKEMFEKEPVSTPEALKNILKTLFSRESLKFGLATLRYQDFESFVKTREKTMGTKTDYLDLGQREASKVNERYDLLASKIVEAKQEKTATEQKLEDALRGFENFKKENNLTN